MLSLIKSGCFDSLEKISREKLLDKYLLSEITEKKKLTMASLPLIIERGLLPKELSFEKRLFNFDKYLKKFEKDKACYFLDHKAIEFFEKYCDMSTLEVSLQNVGHPLRSDILKPVVVPKDITCIKA